MGQLWNKSDFFFQPERAEVLEDMEGTDGGGERKKRIYCAP